MPIDSKECFAALTEDGQLWEIYQAASTGGGGAPTGPAGGDLTGTYPNPTVDGLQGNPVSNAVPVNGQVLQFDGTSWVPGAIPSGGSGGGGVVYFLNFNTAADAPVTNIPQTPNASKELGITAETTATSFTSAILSTASYDFLASFVTDLNVPSATAIPAGLWDFNIWAESTTTNSANHILYKIEVLKYDGVNAPVLLATSADSYIYDPQDITQYVSSVVLPQTTILATDRIVVYLYGRATQNNNTITFHFGGAYPTHTHSTMPSVTGTGVVKVVNGVFQSPASTIVNSDVSASAAIDVSKLAMSTNRLLGRTTAGTGAVEEITVGTGLSLSAGTLSSTVTAGVTSVTATAPLTSSGGATPDISTSIATNKVVGRSTAGTGVMEELTPVGISVSGGNITGIGGTVGTVDNAVPRADGTGGYTVQDSGLIVEDAIVSVTGITGDAGTEIITAPGTAFVTGQPIRFTALTGGTGLNTTTNYFVVNPVGATFQVETSIGGGAINFTTNITAGTLLTGHSVQANVTLSENTTETNSALVLTPKGGGAFILGPKPDGTAAGGNARGQYAVDLQILRGAAGQVASGSRSVCGGERNTANGTTSIAIGYQNTASQQEAVAIGRECNASALNSIAIGNRLQSTAQSATAMGQGSSSDRFGMFAYAADRFSVQGDAQRARFVLRNSTANNTPTALFLDGSSTRLTIPVNKAMGFTIQVIGSIQGMAENAYFVRKGAIVNDNSTTTLIGSIETIGTDQKSAGATTTDVSITADDTNEALIITVTGIAAQNWRWVASVDAVEVQYA